MKIAILHSGDLESLALGGVDQYIKNIIRFKGNNRICIFGTCVKGEYELGKMHPINRNGLEYDFFPVSNDASRPLTLRYMMNVGKYTQELEFFDIIYAQRIELALPFVFCPKIQRKLLQIIHGSSYYKTMNWGIIKKFFYESVERVSICISQRTYIILKREEFGVPYYQRKYKKYRNKIMYAKIPLDTNVFVTLDRAECRIKLGLPLEKKIVIYTGRAKNNPKRIYLFPDIVNMLLKKEDILFLFIGGGDDLDRLIELFEEKVDQDAYKIIGYLSNRRELAEYLCAADINLNISRFEGTCTSSLEAVSCGTPVVSTDVGDIKMIISEGKNGMIVQNTDSEELINSCVSAMIRIFREGVDMDDRYKYYNCENVVCELFEQFETYFQEHIK